MSSVIKWLETGKSILYVLGFIIGVSSSIGWGIINMTQKYSNIEHNIEVLAKSHKKTILRLEKVEQEIMNNKIFREKLIMNVEMINKKLDKLD